MKNNMTEMNEKMMRVLLVEKNKEVRDTLREYLETNDFEVDVFGRPEKALEAFRLRRHAICIISIEATSMEQEFWLADEITAIQLNTVLVFLGWQLTVKMVVQAYSHGADDVIRKPLYLEEVLARLQAILRRTHVAEQPVVQVFVLGKYRFNPHTQRLSMPNGEKVKLTSKETDLLAFLCAHKNQVVSRDDVIKNVWGGTSFYNARSMDIYITKLRRYLEADPSVKIITLHAEGFRLVDNA